MVAQLDLNLNQGYHGCKPKLLPPSDPVIANIYAALHQVGFLLIKLTRVNRV